MTRRGGRGDEDAPSPGASRAGPASIAGAQETTAQKADAGRASDARQQPTRQTNSEPTRATGRPGGAPTGRPTRHDPEDDNITRRAVELENSTAAVLAANGYRVHQNPTQAEVAQARQETGDFGRPGSKPDYLVEGRVFDCYAPKTETSVRNVWTETQKKIRKLQTQRVVVNLADWRGDLAALRKQFADWPIQNAKEVKFVLPDGSLYQIIPNTASDGARPHGA